MIQAIALRPGVTLRYQLDRRFKNSALSIQLLRPMCQEEAALNALLSAVLLRGTEQSPDLQAITQRLDQLYGASIGALVRRVGNIQTTGFYLSFLEDRFALPGDRVLEPMLRFLEEILLHPKLEHNLLCPEFVESEKKNLIATIEAERNDKRAYAATQLLRHMCQGDSFAVPRLGRREEVAAITPESLSAHYRRILHHSPVEIFYVGSAAPEQVAQLLMPLAQALAPQPDALPLPGPFLPQIPPQEQIQTQSLAQSKLCMGFFCGITQHSPDFPAMLVCNAIFGGGMTSKLFVHVREALSLCYYASSAYYSSKGIVTVSCGIDAAQYQRTKEEILAQLAACQAGEITPAELTGAKEALLSSLRGIPDSTGALENYYATAAISGFSWDLPTYMEQVRRVTAEDVARVAKQLQLHSVFFLQGVNP